MVEAAEAVTETHGTKPLRVGLDIGSTTVKAVVLDQSDALAVGDIQIDMADDCFAADDDGEIADGYAHATSLNAGLTSGSMASRRASPNRFNAMTTSVTTRPGHTTANGWNRTDVARECPQLGTPAPTPTPR